MIIQKKVANAVGGKTAQACDNCLRRRARWYCTADDAFLCQACDSSVHSANLLASRHERVRIEKIRDPNHVGSTSLEPAWHQGFMKKARTPRPTKSTVKSRKDIEEENILNPLALVPEISSEENSPHEDEDQSLHCVPIFDPFLFDMSNEIENGFTTSMYDEACELDTIQALDLPSDMDLAEFAADVESLLGGGLDHGDPCGVNDLGFLDCKEEEEENIEIFDDCNIEGRKLVKVEDGMINLEFDYVAGEEEKVRVPVNIRAVMGGDYKEEHVERKRFLSLDYEKVINAWDCKGCPWTDGTRPDLNPNYCLLDFMDSHLVGSSVQWIGGQVRRDDVGREARVTRYREKRRTRLFSKKIRYEVRKLNADKRPRMKGRFVKRSALSSSTSSFASHAPPPFPNYHLLSNK